MNFEVVVPALQNRAFRSNWDHILSISDTQVQMEASMLLESAGEIQMMEIDEMLTALLEASCTRQMLHSTYHLKIRWNGLDDLEFQARIKRTKNDFSNQDMYDPERPLQPQHVSKPPA
jgi:hypothetical protein